jgi:protein involved in polysaccharide export with SLBB domain
MRNYKTIFQIIFLGLVIFLLPAIHTQAQITTNTNLGSVKSEQLSNEQIKLLMQKALNSGMSPEQIEALARAKGLPQAEIDKIKARAEIFSAIKSASGKDGSTNQRIIPNKYVSYATPAGDRLRTGDTNAGRRINNRVFGFSLFTTKDLTFNPGINIASPKNYQLGPGDIVNIDVWGASQKSYQEIISPEGKILIPKIGPVFLSGLTIEKATGKLKKYLSKIYSGLTKGNTFMEVSLGGVRSISVNMVGEVTLPGTYNLSSLATVFNAMYAAGGPADDGSLRNVKIIRNNKTVTILDFYKFLLNGTLPGNMRLQDQDIVFVSPYSDRVEIKGQVKRSNMYFDMKPGETLKNLIHFAGGFTGKAYTGQIKIFRNTATEKKILVVNAAQQDTTMLKDGDMVVVDSILNRFENRVQMTGAVMRPGEFALDSAMTLRQLLHDADGLRRDAYQKRIAVYRLKKDLTRETVSLNLSRLLKSDTGFLLRREDSIHIPSVFDIREKSYLQIEGQVAKPGLYPFTENTRLGDIIIQAGGMLESASMAHIDIARRVIDTTSAKQRTNKLANTYQFPIGKDLKLADSVKNFRLSPFDHIFVRKSFSYTPQLMVSIGGEVNFPGKYTIQTRNERVSDLIRQAGNITPQAFVKGASLIRKRTSHLLHQKAIETVNAANNARKNKIITSNSSYNVIGLNLEKILSHPGSAADLVLRAGDSIRILRKSQTVEVQGAVYRPNVIPYAEGWVLEQYISNAGGFTKDAIKRNIYVIYANGSVKKTTSFLGLKNYPKIEPGAEIIIPLKPKKSSRLSTATAIGLTTALASLTLIIISISKTIKP